MSYEQAKWLTIAGTAVMLVVVVAAIQGAVSCYSEGGTYVRGLFWFVCVR